MTDAELRQQMDGNHPDHHRFQHAAFEINRRQLESLKKPHWVNWLNVTLTALTLAVCVIGYRKEIAALFPSSRAPSSPAAEQSK